jgi:threonine aldolase
MDPEPPSNMVYIKLPPDLPYDAEDIKVKLKKQGILIGYENLRLVRLVTHLWFQDQEIPKVLEGFRKVLS